MGTRMRTDQGQEVVPITQRLVDLTLSEGFQ